MSCFSSRLLAAAALASSLTAGAIYGQSTQKLKGSYVLTETGTTPNGQNFAALASLTLSDNGSVIGTELLQTATGLNSIGVQGTYSLSADNTGTLILSPLSTDTVDNSSIANQDYVLVASANGDILALKSDPGYYTTATLSPAAARNPLGAYAFTERAVGRPFARVVSLKFDAAGAANGFSFEDNFGVTNRVDLRGSYQSQAGGLQTLMLSRDVTLDDGSTQTISQGYTFLATKNDIRMLRTDGNPEGVLILSH